MLERSMSSNAPLLDHTSGNLIDTPYRGHSTPGSRLVEECLAKGFMIESDWERLPLATQKRVRDAKDKHTALGMLTQAGLLTEYQSGKIGAGMTFGLRIGNYRVLDRLGTGGMAVVYRAEHLTMRNLAAIKVVSAEAGQDPRIRNRFSAETRIAARLRHPNLVAALDAGQLVANSHDVGEMCYLVTELVPGVDLDTRVKSQGPLPVWLASSLAYQIADALGEMHRLGMVHRDIKPSNVMLTPEHKAVLLDFGLTHQPNTRLTTPGTVLGTVDYMAPEQARDAGAVDIRADIYSLGATLYWCIAGKAPFSRDGNLSDRVARRLTAEPKKLSDVGRDLPAGFADVVSKIMAFDPADRYQTPQAVMSALLPYVAEESSIAPPPSSLQIATPQSSLCIAAIPTKPDSRKALIIDDEAGIRQYCRAILDVDGLECVEAADGEQALGLIHHQFDLILLDLMLPGLPGHEILKRLRQKVTPHAKIIMLSGSATSDELAQLLFDGADDYLVKPFSVVQLQGRSRAALRLKEVQDRLAVVNSDLLARNAELESSASRHRVEINAAREILTQVVAKLITYQARDSDPRTLRLRQYCVVFCEEAIRGGTFGPRAQSELCRVAESIRSAIRHRNAWPAKPHSAQTRTVFSRRAAPDAIAHGNRLRDPARRGGTTWRGFWISPNGRRHRPTSS